MKASNLKYYIGIILMIAMSSLHVIFFDNNDRYDVYMFYNHDRYLTNILYDIGVLFKFTVLTYWLIKLNKRLFKPLFLSSLFSWLFYFTFYSQLISLLIIPLYLIFALWHNRNILNIFK